MVEGVAPLLHKPNPRRKQATLQRRVLRLSLPLCDHSTLPGAGTGAGGAGGPAGCQPGYQSPGDGSHAGTPPASI